MLCDPQTSGVQIQKVIDSAVNMAALHVRWHVVWAKAHRLLASSGIEDYCRKPFGGPVDLIARLFLTAAASKVARLCATLLGH